MPGGASLDQWVLPAGAGGMPFPLAATDADEIAAQVSPDGRWVASSDFPVWRADGRELFYVAYPDQTLMAVQVDGGGDVFEVGPAETLFSVRVPAQMGGWPYAVSRDGERLLVLLGTEDAADGDAGRRPVNIEFDWTARLPR